MSLPAEALLPFIFGGGSGGGGGGSQTTTDYIAGIGSLGTVALGTTWAGSDPYTSTVTVTGYTVTEKTLVNILPDPDVIEQMQDDGIIEIYITNNGGVLTATAHGGAPTQAITLNVLCTESDFVADIDELTRQMSDSEVNEMLMNSSIPGTTETVVFDSNHKPASVTHTASGVAVRTDVFTWGTNSVTEVRTLANGKHVTLVTNLTTLVTTISEIQEAG